MTWAGKRRKQLPGNWGAIRKAVLVRDGYRCTASVDFVRINGIPHRGRDGRCPNRATEVHHVNGPLDHSLSSLRSICAYHAEAQADAG